MEDPPPHLARYTNPPHSVIHHALRASRRRLVIWLLTSQAPIIPARPSEARPTSSGSTSADIMLSVRSLAKAIVSIEEDIPMHHATGKLYHNAYNALTQTHLPQLDDINAIEYDADRKNVRPGQNLTALVMMTALTSPVAKLLFDTSEADPFSGELSALDGTIDD